MTLISQQARVPLVMVTINGVSIPGYITQPWYQYFGIDVKAAVNNTVVVDSSALAAGAFLSDQSSHYDDALLASQPGPPGADGEIKFIGLFQDVDSSESSPLFPSGAANMPMLEHGTYTPTLTGVANVAASTAYQCQWLRVGNTVTVSGKVDVDPTAAVSTQLGISLPVASNFGAAEDAAGVAFCPAVAGQGAAVLADAANNRLQMQWVAVDVTNQPMYFTATYEVI